MILTDTGPLVALLDADDNYHKLCADALKHLPPGELLTTWPCFTEAMYLLGAAGGYRYQEALWKLRSDGHLIFHELTPPETDRMAELMGKYHDIPMDLADASLVVTAESRKLYRVFTTDGDFYIYRMKDGRAFEVIPMIRR